MNVYISQIKGVTFDQISYYIFHPHFHIIAFLHDGLLLINMFYIHVALRENESYTIQVVNVLQVRYLVMPPLLWSNLWSDELFHPHFHIIAWWSTAHKYVLHICCIKRAQIIHNTSGECPRGQIPYNTISFVDWMELLLNHIWIYDHLFCQTLQICHTLEACSICIWWWQDQYNDLNVPNRNFTPLLSICVYKYLTIKSRVPSYFSYKMQGFVQVLTRSKRPFSWF